MGVRIVTDSACSISDEDIRRLSIETVPLHITIQGTELTGEQLHAPDFYDRLAALTDAPKTSQPSPEEFAKVFRRLSADGDHVLAVLISAGMSGTVQSADVAASELLSSHPDAVVRVLDSRSNSLEEGFAVLSAAEAALGGAQLDECVRAATETIRRTRFLFAPVSLEQLRRGGRISGAARLLSVALKIAPILTADKGKTGVAGVTRGVRSAWARIGSLMRKDVTAHGLRRAAVQYVGDESETARRFASEIVVPITGGNVPIVPIPPVVGVHVGPAIGVVYETERPCATDGLQNREAGIPRFEATFDAMGVLDQASWCLVPTFRHFAFEGTLRGIHRECGAFVEGLGACPRTGVDDLALERRERVDAGHDLSHAT